MSFQKTLFAYLEQLPRPTLDRLYSEPSTCLAILRCLPDTAKLVIIRLATISANCEYEQMQNWVFHDNLKTLNEDLEVLERMHLCQKQIMKDSSRASHHSSSHIQYTIHPVFREYLLQALMCSGASNSFGVSPELEDKHQVDIEFLDKYSAEAWESVLHYLVGSPSEKRPKAVMKLLEKSGLMTNPDGSVGPDGAPNLVITNKGFQFLLQDTNVQVWAFLLQYLELANELNMNPVEVLHFLFQLGTLQVGQDYSVASLTPTQQHMLDDLKHLGLVYQRKKKSSRFYPTRLATSLTSGKMTASQKNDEEGFIILETNYRVYAYTTSPLQIAVLSLFIDLKARFPNMVIGLVTRERVREALEKGITSEQIITYLETHAHPEMRKTQPIVPATVIDQIKIWDRERNRIDVTLGHLYQQFSRQEEFLEVLNYAKDLGCLVWYSDKKRMLTVTAEGQENVRQFVKRKSGM